MKWRETALKEEVIDGFYPEVFEHQRSEQIYQYYVGSELPDDKLFILIGTDSGKLIDYLAKNAKSGQRYVFLEHQEVITALETLEKKYFNNFKYELCSFEEFEFEYLYESYQDYVVRNAVTILSSLMLDSDHKAYQGLSKKYQERYHQFLIDRMDNRDFKPFFDKQLDNTCDLIHPLSTIKDKLNSLVPAIILGGGPTLDETIPWLKENQHKVVIFAASRICKRLLKEHITPDFIGLFDYQELIFDYSKEMFEFQDSSVLVTSEHPYTGLIRQWPGLKAYSRRRFPWAKGGEDNFISDGPTVTNGMFGIAAYLGAKEIYLAGVDFCFTKEGVCHESGSIEAKNKQTDKVDTTALNYRGEEVGTNIQLYDARNAFEEQLQRLKLTYPSLKVFNLNDGAAVIKEIAFKPLESLSLTHEKQSVAEQFALPLKNNVPVQAAFQKKLKQDIKTSNQWFLSIIKEAKLGLKMTQNLFENRSKQQKRIDKVLKQKSKLEKMIGPDYMTMVNYAYEAFMASLKPVESEAEMTQQEIRDSLAGFFGGLLAAAQGFKLKLLDVSEELERRQLEILPTTPFGTLANMWLEQSIPGRFYVWLKAFAEQDYNYYQQQFPELVESLETQFKNRLEDDSALQKAFKQRLDTPQEFAFRLQDAFAEKNLIKLKNIVRQLKFANDPAYQLTKSYAAGLQLELKNEPKEALLHYLRIDPKQNIVLIQERVYPLAFLLKKNQTGCDALKNLSQFSEKYLPFYADALIVSGREDQAIKVYETYLAKEADTNALIQLLKLFIKRQEVDHANNWLMHVDGNKAFDQDALQIFVDSLNQGDL